MHDSRQFRMDALADAPGARVTISKSAYKREEPGRFFVAMLAKSQLIKAPKSDSSICGPQKPDRTVDDSISPFEPKVRGIEGARSPQGQGAVSRSSVTCQGSTASTQLASIAQAGGETKPFEGKTIDSSPGRESSKKAAPKEPAASSPDLAAAEVSAAPMQVVPASDSAAKVGFGNQIVNAITAPDLSESKPNILLSKVSNSVDKTIAKAKPHKPEAVEVAGASVSREVRLPMEPVTENAVPVHPASSRDPVQLVGDLSMGVIGAVAVGHGPATDGHPALTERVESNSLAQPDISLQATDLKTLVATPNVLEVGISSGSHGWLKVRAELAQTGEVLASVLANSPSAAQSLHKELPGIAAYLAGERVGISSLVVNSADHGPETFGSPFAAGSNGSQGSAGGSDQRGKHVPQATQERSIFDPTHGSDASSLLGALGVNMPSILSVNGSGGWLSVRV